MPETYQETYKGWDVYRVQSQVYYAFRNGIRIHANSKTEIMRAIAARVIADLEERLATLELAVGQLEALRPSPDHKTRVITLEAVQESHHDRLAYSSGMLAAHADRLAQLEQSVMTLAAEPKTADRFRFTTHTRTASPITHGTNCGCCELVSKVRECLTCHSTKHDFCGTP
jgi:hypothetical protein